MRHLAKDVIEVGDEDDDEGETAKDVEETGHISGTGRTHQVPAGKGVMLCKSSISMSPDITSGDSPDILSRFVKRHSAR